MKYFIVVIALALLLGLAFFLVHRPEADGGIIITSPEVAEIVSLVAGVGAIDAVVRQCDWPPALQQLPQVGAFGDVNLQALLERRPTLVFTASPAQDALTEKLLTLGVNARSMPLYSVGDLLEAVRMVGELTGNEARAAHLADSLAAAFSAARADTIYAQRVYVEVDPGLWTVSGSSLLGEVVRLAGGRNLYEDADWTYAQVDAADVVAANPDVIVAVYPHVTPQDIAARKGWENVTAIREGRVFTRPSFDADLLVRCGPRLPQGVARLKQLLQGGAEASDESR